MAKFDADPKNGTAAILVDGEEFIRCDSSEGTEVFEETVKKEYIDSNGKHEIALMVWKPRFRFWIRAKYQF